MVFIALPALQRNQRDAQRKQDVNRLLDAAQRYLANNPRVSNFPSVTFYGGIINSYIFASGDKFEDPDGSEYHVD